eukprot:TRINITY_DN64243_c0_g1_i1.p1 TRINITY_DN64243_c0_g1~~TRINITY_DN64243_c0_g1_i1.p1  ORF type:complete len:245 (+),score=52.64 TRINITY_DN64243_c0_g1_i1:69-737(+)
MAPEPEPAAGEASEAAADAPAAEEKVAAEPAMFNGRILASDRSFGLNGDIRLVRYRDEHDMPGIVELIEKDLSEPYSVFTYRYFINNWRELCFLAVREEKIVGAIVCKLDVHRCNNTYRGYIAMLAVDKELRGHGLGSALVRLALDQMREMDADECVLETELTNKGALGLYRSTGFVKEKRLHKYYLNGNDAYRLKYLFRLPEGFDKGQGCLGPPARDPVES